MTRKVIALLKSRALLATVTLTVIVSSMTGVQAAQATAPAKPAGVRVAAERTSSSSFTVAMNRSARATHYRVYTASSKQALYVSHITSRTRHATSSRPSVRVTGVRYTAAPVYYRVETLSARSHHWDATVRAVGLKPPTTTGLAVHRSTAGVYVTWRPQATGDGFVVSQALNPAMTAGRADRAVAAQNYLYSPVGLRQGTTYYFRVRARNLSTLSSWSATVSVTATTASVGMRTLTYNVQEADAVGQKEGDGRVPAWSARRAGAAALIKQVSPDIASIQEAAAWTTSRQGYGGTRQIDDLLRLLPGYALAYTETPPSQHGYFRTGVYIIYKTATVSPVGTGGHWNLGNTRWAAYQLMQNKQTGARFLYIAAHLLVGQGKSFDVARRNEATVMVRNAQAMAAQANVGVVYGGDFNSDTTRAHAFDGPSMVMRATHNVDMRAVALSHTNAQYNSANQYQRVALADGRDIDYLFASPGISVLSWGVALHLSRGRFVGVIPSDHNPVWATFEVSA